MWKKALYNFLCNIGIFFCFIAAYEGFEAKRYEFIAAGVFGIIVLVAIKMRLIKEVRNLNKKP